MRKGKFITFEGPEKSGKSTQARLLEAYLRRRGYRTLFVREPGSTKIGETIRRLLLDKKNDEMVLMTEMLLYMAARAQFVKDVIRPALQKGTVVLCDRFLDSTLAYQGYGCGLDIAMIEKIGLWVTGGLRPDLTLLLDFWASPHYLKNNKTPDRIEMRSSAFHRRVKRGYGLLARQEPRRIKVIRVQDDYRKTQGSIRTVVEQCLLKKS
ncbi:MAG: dTMP kinase [Candidatus Omnitrophota bacterium]